MIRSNPRRLAGVVIAALAIVATACGGDTSPSATTVADGGSIDVLMTDIAFDASSVRVTKGSTVEFRFTNTGKIAHDAFVGDQAAQDEHEAEMAGMPEGHEHDSDGSAVTVQPGETEVLTYTFDEPGPLQVGCHQKGHYVAGMYFTVLVD